MTIQLQPELENEVRRLADERGRDVQAIVSEAVRQYIEAAAITDVTPEQVGQMQEAIVPEMSDIEGWEGQEAG